MLVLFLGLGLRGELRFMAHWGSGGGGGGGGGNDSDSCGMMADALLMKG